VRQHDRVRRHSPIAITSLAAISLLTLVACTPGDDEGATGCASTVADATAESEPSDQVRLLDRALIVCGSYDAFTTALGRYPSSIGYDAATYAERRCDTVDDENVRNGPTCSAVIVPATTAPPTTLVELLFVGDTVDGRPIEIRPSDGIEFIGEVPAVIQQTVDIALESGCEGVIAQRDLWVTRIDDTPDGDIASVYAQHAQNVANFIDCDTDPIEPG
jgi:hypothetical protein